MKVLENEIRKACMVYLQNVVKMVAARLQAVIESGNLAKAVKFKNGWIEFETNEDYGTAIK